MKRTTIFLTKSQIEGLTEATKTDVLGMATLIRIFVSEGLARRKRAAKQATAK
jgi:hypothetical protein